MSTGNDDDGHGILDGSSPQRRYPEPSIHPSNERTKEPPTLDDSAAAGQGRLDEMVRVENALRKAGVKGVNVRRFARVPELTAEYVTILAEEIQSDPGVRIVPAVMVRRLSEVFRVQLKSDQRIGSEINRQVRSLQSVVSSRRGELNIDAATERPESSR